MIADDRRAVGSDRTGGHPSDRHHIGEFRCIHPAVAIDDEFMQKRYHRIAAAEGDKPDDEESNK